MTNNKCELYEFSLHTVRELHTNHELCITNREYAHSAAAPLRIILTSRVSKRGQVRNGLLLISTNQRVYLINQFFFSSFWRTSLMRKISSHLATFLYVSYLLSCVLCLSVLLRSGIYINKDSSPFWNYLVKHHYNDQEYYGLHFGLANTLYDIYLMTKMPPIKRKFDSSA